MASIINCNCFKVVIILFVILFTTAFLEPVINRGKVVLVALDGKSGTIIVVLVDVFIFLILLVKPIPVLGLVFRRKRGVFVDLVIVILEAGPVRVRVRLQEPGLCSCTNLDALK